MTHCWPVPVEGYEGKPTVGSLFSGIGGLDLGLERAGFEIKWQVENDDFCRRVLAKHWPHVPCYGDIRELDGRQLAPVDLICGGFPCQPVSRAGRRQGGDDSRWLWPDFARVIRELRPNFVLVENVPGLLDGGIGDVLGDLATLGFDAEWGVFGACAFGAPMHRERVWLLANAHNARLEGPIWAGQSPAPRQERAPTRSESLRSDRGHWPPGPREVNDIPRMVDGPSHRVDRLKALGNAVVPQAAEYIGRQLMAVLKS
jgi:DNA (cytosine-5)-methyltransferase 1